VTRFMATMWLTFKCVVSLGAVACGAWIFFTLTSAGMPWLGGPLLALSGMLFLAAAPWTFRGWGIYSRAAGLAGLFFGIALAIMGARYSLGENAAIVSAVFITSAFFVLGSIYVLVRRKSAE
jgi:hypothetical protein